MPETKVAANELARLFDGLPNVVFFIKNRAGCYTHVNQTLVRRLGLTCRDELIGRDPGAVFPAALGAAYAAQDRRVLAGNRLENTLEVHLFPDRAPGWCLTCKYPLGGVGKPRGVIGISRDLGRPDERNHTFERLAQVVTWLEEHYAEGVRVKTLARLAGLSVAQLERHFRRVFQISPGQMLTKLRMDAAMRRLCEPGSIADIAAACGYCDQSAFTRQFRRLVGLTPRQYRVLRGAQRPD